MKAATQAAPDVHVIRESKEAVASRVAVTMCRRPGCPREAKCRGLCLSDYHVAHGLVALGLVTWDALERSGRVAATKRTAKQWFLEAA